MTNEEKFEGFDFRANAYEQEARERWGNKAVDDSMQKLTQIPEEKRSNLSYQMNAIYKELASIRYQSPASDSAQKAIKRWYDFLNLHVTPYSLDAFKGLGQLYVADARFTKNIDQFGEGLAQFMCDAMAVFADQNKADDL